MGGLQIVRGGIIATGQVHVMDTLVASKIVSKKEAPIKILASHNITLSATDDHGTPTNSMLLSKLMLYNIIFILWMTMVHSLVLCF